MKKAFLFILTAYIIVVAFIKIFNSETYVRQTTDLNENYNTVNNTEEENYDEYSHTEIATGEREGTEQEEEDKITKIQDIIKYSSEGNLKKLSQYINYPLRRSYPLPVIRDSSEFVKYAEIIWDDSLKNIMKTITLEDLNSFAWRGLSFKNGEYMWIEEEKIKNITYYSGKELSLQKRLYEDEINSLHPSLRNGIDHPWILFEDTNKKLYGRVDIMNNKKHRISIYDKSQKLSEKPVFVALDSIYNIEGSMANTYLLFSKDSIKVELLYSYYIECFLFIEKNGERTKYEIDCDYRLKTVPQLIKEGYLH